MSEMHDKIRSTLLSDDAELLLLIIADHIGLLEAKVEQLERFLPAHLQAPTVATLDVVAEQGCKVTTETAQPIDDTGRL